MNIDYLNFTNTTSFHEGKVPYFTSRQLDKIDFITHAFSTRLGGVSSGQYESMNLSYTVGDDERNVRENFNIFGNAIRILPANMVYSKQTHTTNVLKITKDHLGMGIYRDRDFDNIDGLITNEPGICLVTSYADCVPLYIVDPVNKAIGLSHSGWKGTVGDIASVTVNKMAEEYSSNPNDLIVFIGPSICQGCYEIGEDVAEHFAVKYGPNVFDKILYPKENGKFHLNLWQANVTNFINAGVKENNISITDICTCHNPNVLFSHRASKGKRGGLCAFLMIK